MPTPPDGDHRMMLQEKNRRQSFASGELQHLLVFQFPGFAISHPLHRPNGAGHPYGQAKHSFKLLAFQLPDL
jgi:hypothetical protein